MAGGVLIVVVMAFVMIPGLIFSLMGIAVLIGESGTKDGEERYEGTDYVKMI